MRALQRAIADACLAADAGEEMARDLRGFLVARDVAPEDVEAIAAAPQRLQVYRSLVRNGLSSVVLRMLPRTRARMNAACAGRFDTDLASFVDQVGPRTHYVRDVPAEYFAWAQLRWRSDPQVPAYLPDLAALELAHYAVAAAESAQGPAVHPGDVALDRPLAFIESACLARYAWAVHELSPDEAATDEPPRRDTSLLGYRDATHAVRWLDLTPAAAAILERLLAGEDLGRAVEGACAVHGLEPPSILADVARLLADLGDRGVLIGARAELPPIPPRKRGG
jgi:hypothetical protein